MTERADIVIRRAREERVIRSLTKEPQSTLQLHKRFSINRSTLFGMLDAMRADKRIHQVRIGGGCFWKAGPDPRTLPAPVLPTIGRAFLRDPLVAALFGPAKAAV